MNPLFALSDIIAILWICRDVWPFARNVGCAFAGSNQTLCKTQETSCGE